MDSPADLKRRMDAKLARAQQEVVNARRGSAVQIINAEAFENQDAKEAEAKVTAALKKTELIQDLPSVEVALVNFATFHCGPQGRIAEAEKALDRLFLLRQKMRGAHTLKLSEIAHHMWVLELMEKHSEMLRVLWVLFLAREAHYGTSSAKLISVTEYLFSILIRKGDLREAQKTAKQLIRIREQSFPEDPEEQAKSIWEKARIHLVKGELSKSEALCVKALHLLPPLDEQKLSDLAKKLNLRKPINPEDPSKRIESLSALCGQINSTLARATQWHQGLEVEAVFAHARTLLQEGLGVTHPDTVVHTLAEVAFLSRRGYHDRAADACTTLTQALKQRRDACHNPMVVRTLGQLGHLRLHTFELKLGIELLTEAVELCRRLRGHNHWEVGVHLRTCASFHEHIRYATMHELCRAEAFLQEALDLEYHNAVQAAKEKKDRQNARREAAIAYNNDENTRVKIDLDDLSDGEEEEEEIRRKAMQGEEICRSAAAAVGDVGGPAGRGWARTLGSLGRLYVRMRHLEDAERVLKAYATLLRKDPCVDDAMGVTRTLEALAEFHSAKGQPKEAEEALQWALKQLLLDERDGFKHAVSVDRIKRRLCAVRSGETLTLSNEFLVDWLRDCDGCGRKERRPGEYHTFLSGGVLRFCSVECRERHEFDMSTIDFTSFLRASLMKRIFSFTQESSKWGVLAQVCRRWWRMVSQWRRTLVLPKGCGLDAGTVASLCARCTHLSELDLSEVVVDDNVLEAIGGCCHSLLKLGIRGCRFVTDDGFAALGEGCPGILDLDMAHCDGLSDEGLATLAMGMQSLQRLSVVACSMITEVGLIGLSEHCHDLRYLDVSFCYRITDRGFSALRVGCKSLEYLAMLGVNGISRPEMDRLRRAIKTIVLEETTED